MRIDGITVSVNYADELRSGIDRWVAGLDRLTVVTDSQDGETPEVVRSAGADLFVTDAFYEDGAAFNKGRAMEAARKAANAPEWLLLFDADIVPPDDWRTRLDASSLVSGWFYGADRYVDGGERVPDDTHGYGYFQLFHAGDPLAQKDPLISTDWRHGGNYDSDLMLQWRRAGRLAEPLDLRLTHLGPVDHNWWGRGRKDLFDAMERERERRGGGWASIEHERLSPS